MSTAVEKQEILPVVSSAKILNPFEGERKSVAISGSNNVEVHRAVAEVQASIMLAKQFPRVKVESADRILTECTRLSLARVAVYSFPKGGQEVSGPTIRLAEMLAREWGNIQFSWDIISKTEDASEILAWAWDTQTNVRTSRRFHVKHWRDTKKGGHPIKDERDIYELCANQAARRMRSCILNLIPGDIIEAALDQCEQTMKTKEVINQESVDGLLKAFAEYGVSKAQIEKRLGRKVSVESMNGAVMMQLRKIYAGIRDGLAKVEEFFEPEQALPEAKAEVKKTEVIDQTTGEITEAQDWDAAVDELVIGVERCKTADELTDFIDENSQQIESLDKSGAKEAVKKWALALNKKRGALK